MNFQPFFTIPILLLISVCTYAQPERYTYQYVWDIDSAKVYSEPSVDSELITKIRYGKKLLVLDFLKELKTDPSFEIEPEFEGDFPVKPYWMKVRYNSKEGYVKSDMIGILPPFHRTEYGVETFEEYFERTFGKIDEVEKEVPININGKSYTAHLDSIRFGNQIYKTEQMFDSCIDYKFKIVGLDFYQTLNILYFTTYHESMVNNGPPGEPNIVRAGYGVSLVGKEGNTYFFDGAFTAEEVYLKQLHETEFIFGHYYCI